MARIHLSLSRKHLQITVMMTQITVQIPDSENESKPVDGDLAPVDNSHPRPDTSSNNISMAQKNREFEWRKQNIPCMDTSSQITFETIHNTPLEYFAQLLI